LKRFGNLRRTAKNSGGYREVIDHLAGGDRETMLVDMKTRTRRFAKRQGTWFRGLSECRFVDLADETAPEAVAEQIARLTTA